MCLRPPAPNSPPPVEQCTIVKEVQPSCVIGAVGVVPNCFTREIIDALMDANTEYRKESTNPEYGDRPIVFALSNPKTQAEITAENAYTWSAGQVPCPPPPPVRLRRQALPLPSSLVLLSPMPAPLPAHAAWPLKEREATGRDALEGGEGTPPLPLQGAQPMPSRCPSDAKCRLQWHL